MEEIISKIVSAAIIANTPLLARAIATELNKQPKTVHTTTRQAGARQLGMSLPTFDKLVAEGVIKAQKVGRKVLIDQSEIDALLQNGNARNLKYRRH